jgi:hypothetical protein
MSRMVVVGMLISLLAGLSCLAAGNPYLGKWDISGKPPNEKVVYWLEVKLEGGKLAGSFLNRSGSVLPVPEIAMEKGELVFSLKPARPEAPKPTFRANVVKGQLLGTMTAGPEKVEWIGVRPPKWRKYNANGKHSFGKPIALFNGKDMSGWSFQLGKKPSGWVVTDGVMTNEDRADNIISMEKFKDFKVEVEYKLQAKSNSGIYLRGRYELQVLDDAGVEPNIHGHMAVYSRVKPTVNASKPAGEWQSMEATLVGNRVTVILNGKKVHDNVEIEGITGDALDSNEGAPGPLMIQGDHGRIWVRKVVITPIK